MKFLQRMLSDEKGLETVEYAVLTAMIVTGLVTALTTLSLAIAARFSDTATRVDNIQ